MNPEATKELTKKPWSYNVLLIGVVTLMAVGSWVVLEVYRSFTKTTVPKVLQSQIKPIKGRIDEKLIENIKARRQFSEQELSGIVPYIPPEEAERIAKEQEKNQPNAGEKLSPFAKLSGPTPTPSIATESSVPRQSTNSGQIAL